MKRLLQFADRLLHGDAPTRDGTGMKPITSAALFGIIVLLGAGYGACMGLYGWRWGAAYGPSHVLAVMIKVPTLFLLTLAVTCPSLYVFAALAGAKLRARDVLWTFLAATGLTTTVLASLGPVTVFFTFCTRSHPFLQLLNAVLFTVAGVVGLRFVTRRLHTAFRSSDGEAERPGRGRVERRTFGLLTVWCVLYGAVAAQMGWLLRPFVGTPHLPQELFRHTEGNVFQGLLDALRFLD